MSGDRTSPRYEMVASTRRQFSREQKRTIVAEVERGATVSEVARRHNVHTSLLFRWRREFASASSPVSAAPQTPEPKTATFLPVRVAAPAPSTSPEPRPEPSRRSAVIEIELMSGRKLRVGADVDIAVLKRIIAVLEAA
jgi:transposase